MKRMSMILAALATQALIADGDATFTYSAKNYVQNGLIGHFDALENVGYGMRDATSSTWKNLVGTNAVSDLPLTPLTAWSWGNAWLNITSGDNNSSSRLIPSSTFSLSQFTFENVARTGSDKNCRRWEVTPWASSFESWYNTSEGYLERMSREGFTTRQAAYTVATANLDIHFATVYDGYCHMPHAYVNGQRYLKSATIPNFAFTGKIAFFGAMKDGRAYALRIYSRALTEEELSLNDVLDQIRFYGKTTTTAVLPSGWSFDAQGVLRTANGKVMLRPEASAATRAITNVSFSTEGDETVCTVTFEADASAATNVLYLAWGDRDCGARAEDWPRLLRQKRVLPEANSVSFPLPSDCTGYAPNVYMRLFLSVASRPYDYRLTSIGATGTQWLDTDYCANPKTVADFRTQMTDLTVQQRVFGCDGDSAEDTEFSFSCYLNGGAEWAYNANDGTGCWMSSKCPAKNEPTRILLSAPSASLILVSPSYNASMSSIARSRTQTSTTPQAIFADARRQGTVHVRPMLGGVISFASYSEDGEWVRAYEPCLVDGRAAFHEAVSGRICFSSTGVDFVATGTNDDNATAVGEVLSGASESYLVPHGASYRADNDSPLTVDYQLLYSNGGSKGGAGPLVLTHPENGFGGLFTVYDGLLAANFGAGLAQTDHLVLDGGAWAPGGSSFDVPLGTGAGQVELKGTRAGFGAYAGDLAITFNGGTGPIAYPSDNFSSQSLILNDASCSNTLTVAQALTGIGATPLTLEVGGGTAVLEKAPTGYTSVTKTGMGTARFTDGAYDLPPLGFAGGASIFKSEVEGAGTLSVAGGMAVSNNSEVAVDQKSFTPSGNVTVETSSSLSLRDSTVESASDFLIGSSGSGKKTGTLKLDNVDFEARILTLGGRMNGWPVYGGLIITNGTEITVSELNAKAGTAYQYGGTIRVTSGETGSLQIGSALDSFYDYYLYGGVLERVSQAGNFHIGRVAVPANWYYGCTGRLYVEKTGRLLTHCQFPAVGRYRYNKGELYVRNGGYWSADFNGSEDVAVCVGDEGSGILEVASGGEIDVAGYVQLADSYTHEERTAEVRVLDGGTLRTRGIWRPNDPCESAAVILDGGLVQVRSDGTPRNPFLVNMTSAQLGVAGTTIDTNGRDVLFRQNLSPRSGQTWTQPSTAADIASCKAFTKAGAGTLTLEGSNSYAVATCVAEGTLSAATANALPAGGLVKLAGGSLALNGTTQNIALLAGRGSVSGGSLTVADAIWPGLGTEGGVLTVSGGTLTAPKLHYAVSSNETGTVCGKLVHTGLFDLTGVEIVVDDVEKLKSGCSILEAGTLTGTPTWSLPSPYRVTKQGNSLRLVAAVGTVVTVR